MTKRREVLRVTQSPMNKLQWCLTLDCGHDVWITRRSRPSLKTAACDRCKEPTA